MSDKSPFNVRIKGVLIDRVKARVKRIKDKQGDKATSLNKEASKVIEAGLDALDKVKG